MRLNGQIEERDIYLADSVKSSTVNVCNKSNREGDYEWKLRIYKPLEVNEQEILAHKTVQSLREWLVAEKKAVIERKPPKPPGADRGIAPLPPPDDDLPWIERAVAIVEICLDELVAEFLKKPWLHRVEHSLHARLFAMLAAHPHLSAELPLENGAITQPIHKEWPETVPSENTRRGNFDLAILSPALLANSSVEAFWRGNIAAPIVIELGLGYGAGHLGQDVIKLAQSQVKHGYLVHFKRRPISERERKLIEAGGPAKVAFACTHGVRQFKRVNDLEIQTLA